MIQNVLRAIGGIGVFDAISICLFIGVFLGATVWAFSRRSSFLATMSSMPLSDDDPTPKGTEHHE